MKQFESFGLAIVNFLQDVKTWLDERVPRDDTEVAEIADTKNMWAKVCENPRLYVQYDKLYDDVCNHSRGFFVRRGINMFDNSMYFAVINVLSAADAYYRVDGDYQKLELAEAIKKYKMLRAKNAFARFKISLSNPQKLMFQKQK